MPRVTMVKKAAKPQGNCGGCGKEINAGEPYKWLKKRYGGKKVRCESCAFKPSDHTGGRLGEVYAAMEDAETNVESWGGEDLDELKGFMESFKERLDELASEYEESCENIREHFEGSEKADECEEKAENIRSWMDDIEAAADNLDEYNDDDHAPEECPECRGKVEKSETNEDHWVCVEEDCGEEFENEEAKLTWIEETRDAALAAVNDCPL